MATTSKHLALALHAISPPLSALHASRLRLHDPGKCALTPLTCPRCGHTPLQTRSVRKKANGRVVERTCIACDLVETVAAPSGAASQFESIRKRNTRHKMSPGVDIPNTGPSPPMPSFSQPPAPSIVAPAPELHSQHSDPKPKRPKKKPGLQEMLARNRQRQEMQKQGASRGGAGLSSFLQGL